MPSEQAARKARRKERRKAAAKAEIEEGSKARHICDESGEVAEKVSNTFRAGTVLESFLLTGIG